VAKHVDLRGEQTVAVKRAPVGRRGLIAGAAALAAGLLAKQAADPVSAGSDGDVIAGSTTNTNTSTKLVLGPHIETGPSFIGDNGFNPGSFDANGDGIQGYTTNPDQNKSNAAIFGRVNDLNGVGTWGEAPNGTGAFGESGAGSGTAGRSTSAAGVYGQSTSGNGVFGISSSSIGVFGQSSTSYGVLGTSTSAHGVTGSTSSAGYAALIGQAAATGTTALSGVVASGVTGAYAAQFSGTVLVNGAMVVGGGGKSAAAKHKDGTHRLLYCVESPDSWFEDFGEGKLVNGKADITLDPEFAGVVDTGQMHVFLTPHDADQHLAATARGKDGFSVSASEAMLKAAGKSLTQANGTFSNRVVAKRGDIATPRLAKFTMPTLQGVTIPQPPKPALPASRGKKP
jgi:hypothetical protein